MKKKKRTYAEVMDELHFDLQNSKNASKVYVFVEGESDLRLFRKLFRTDVKIEPIPGGNPKVEEAVEYMRDELKHPLVLGIRDADFLHFTHPNYAKANIVLTDYHDLEITILGTSDVLKSLFAEFAPEKEMELLPALEILRELSTLKLLYNQEESVDLRRGVGNFINKSTQEIDLEGFIKERFKGKTNEEVESILLNVRKAVKENHDLLQLSNGHHTTELLSKMLNCTNKEVERYFRITYRLDDFKTTRMYAQINAWAEEYGVVLFEA